jgi:hypothetical protein
LRRVANSCDEWPTPARGVGPPNHSGQLSAGRGQALRPRTSLPARSGSRRVLAMIVELWCVKSAGSFSRRISGNNVSSERSPARSRMRATGSLGRGRAVDALLDTEFVGARETLPQLIASSPPATTRRSFTRRSCNGVLRRQLGCYRRTGAVGRVVAGGATGCGGATMGRTGGLGGGCCAGPTPVG